VFLNILKDKQLILEVILSPLNKLLLIIKAKVILKLKNSYKNKKSLDKIESLEKKV